MKTWWLSFAVIGRNLGVIIVDAKSIPKAIARVNKLGINPGGEVMALDMSCPKAQEEAARFPRNTLISPEQLRAANYKSTTDDPMARMAGALYGTFVSQNCNN